MCFCPSEVAIERYVFRQENVCRQVKLPVTRVRRTVIRELHERAAQALTLKRRVNGNVRD